MVDLADRRRISLRRVKTVSTSEPKKKTRPALSPEARENQLISLATDLIEQRLRDGTASSQETTAIIKGSLAKSRLEVEILKKQKELIEAKTEALHSAKRIEELYTNALSAMRKYNGQESDDFEDEDYEGY